MTTQDYTTIGRNRELREYDATYNITTGTFKGGAWITETRKETHSLSAPDLFEARKVAENHRTEINTRIPINSSVKLDKVVEAENGDYEI